MFIASVQNNARYKAGDFRGCALLKQPVNRTFADISAIHPGCHILPAYCMKDLDFSGNISSGTKYRLSPEGVSFMDETNNLDKQIVHKTKQDNL
jgi:hypothetical protein